MQHNSRSEVSKSYMIDRPYSALVLYFLCAFIYFYDYDCIWQTETSTVHEFPALQTEKTIFKTDTLKQ